MTWTLTSSPTRRAAAAPASVAALTAPTSPRTADHDQSGADEFLARQNHVCGFDHGIGGFNRTDQTLRSNQTEGLHQILQYSKTLT
jgi:hypothetical protein